MRDLESDGASVEQETSKISAKTNLTEQAIMSHAFKMFTLAQMLKLGDMFQRVKTCPTKTPFHYTSVNTSISRKIACARQYL